MIFQPCFSAVAMKERMMAKSRTPCSERKPPAGEFKRTALVNLSYRCQRPAQSRQGARYHHQTQRWWAWRDLHPGQYSVGY
jgi:hypothetical protein